MQTLRRHNRVPQCPRLQILLLQKMRRRRRTRLSSPMLYHFGGRRFHRALGLRFYPRQQRHWKMTSPNSKIQALCQVCGKSVLVDPYGNGFCENCGWVQNREYDKYPDDVRYPNIVSFNKAKRLFAESKPLSPFCASNLCKYFETFILTFSNICLAIYQHKTANQQKIMLTYQVEYI